MKATKEQFSEFIKTLGEVVGKNITDRMVKTYWDVLFKVDAEALKEAAQVLIAKGKWASINDWLDECGYATKKTRKERYDATAQQELIDVKTKSPMVESGEMTWMFEAETESETQADLLFSEKERQLKAQGWTVRGTTTNRARTRPEGKAPSKTIFVRFWDCIKVQPYNPSRRFNTPQEGMAAIKKLLGPEMASKLIPCAESYEKRPTSVETGPVDQWEF
jgi:phage antirepressor YoqD-like protein